MVDEEKANLETGIKDSSVLSISCCQHLCTVYFWIRDLFQETGCQTLNLFFVSHQN